VPAYHNEKLHAHIITNWFCQLVRSQILLSYLNTRQNKLVSTNIWHHSSQLGKRFFLKTMASDLMQWESTAQNQQPSTNSTVWKFFLSLIPNVAAPCPESLGVTTAAVSFFVFLLGSWKSTWFLAFYYREIMSLVAVYKSNIAAWIFFPRLVKEDCPWFALLNFQIWDRHLLHF
jgi:hypothetical protein